ncbi:MAG TPA: hypothetical protein VFZ44_11215 [Pyrinomonadaceae bacterium]
MASRSPTDAAAASTTVAPTVLKKPRRVSAMSAPTTPPALKLRSTSGSET